MSPSRFLKNCCRVNFDRLSDQPVRSPVCGEGTNGILFRLCCLHLRVNLAKHITTPSLHVDWGLLYVQIVDILIEMRFFERFVIRMNDLNLVGSFILFVNLVLATNHQALTPVDMCFFCWEIHRIAILK